MNARDAFLDRMWRRRLALGLRLADVGAQLGVHGNTVGKWENRVAAPRAGMAGLWAEALGVAVVGGSLDAIFRPERSPCGTPNGYRQHRVRSERCPECWAAWSAYVLALKKKRAGSGL